MLLAKEDEHLRTMAFMVWFSLILGFFLLAGIPNSREIEVLRVAKADSGKQVSGKLGSVIQIELEEQGATGYLWQFDALTKEYFEVIKIETEKLNRAGLTGTRLCKRWYLGTKKTGATKIILHYFRPWEGKEKAVDTFTLSVRIH